MKAASIACLMVMASAFLAGNALGTTYFVSTKGDDASPGTKKAPFRTIQKAADVMQPGDQCLVRKGTYRETVKPAQSGSEGKPITFRSCKSEAVVISGADPITDWKAAGARWEAKTDFAFNQLFVDGRMMNLARFPNIGIDPFDPVRGKAAKGSSHNEITDPALPDVDLGGAMVCVLPGAHWVSWTRPIKSYDRARKAIQFEGSWGQDWAHEVKEGSKYHVFGSASLLDAPGEWFRDEASGEVSLIGPTGADIAKCMVEAKLRDLAFDLAGKSYINVEGFRIFAATVSLSDSAHCLVEDCHVRFASHFTDCEGWSSKNGTGIVISGHDNTVRNSSVCYSAGNGVTLLGERNTIENCDVSFVNYAAIDCGAVWAEGTENVIRQNTLSNSGRSILVHRTLKAGRIEYNNMFNAGLLTTDLGLTYCFQTDGAGTVIAYNWVHHNLAEGCGVGIYIDNGSSNFLIHHNVSFCNQDSGIRLNTPSISNRVFNNTVLNNGNSLNLWGPENNKEQPGCVIKNNVFNNDVVTGNGADVSHNYTERGMPVASLEKKDFRLERGSPCIDAGVVVKGITDEFKGKAPDLGAYETGQKPWKPGHTWGREVR